MPLKPKTAVITFQIHCMSNLVIDTSKNNVIFTLMYDKTYYTVRHHFY